jgi:hypothetical protein
MLVAHAAAGKLVDIHEREDGTVLIRHGGDELEATAVPSAAPPRPPPTASSAPRE